jgi:hypothetical protein
VRIAVVSKAVELSAAAGCRGKALVFSLALVVLAASGCGGSTPTVHGRITCDGNPVVGVVLFSPKAVDGGNAGPPVSAELKEDGSYELQLTTPGTYTVMVTPRDVNPRPRPGQFDYPCDRSPREQTVKAGDNEISIQLPRRTR